MRQAVLNAEQLSKVLGSGSYEVVATFQEVPGTGETVTRLEVQVVGDWELQELMRREGREF